MQQVWIVGGFERTVKVTESGRKTPTILEIGKAFMVRVHNRKKATMDFDFVTERFMEKGTILITDSFDKGT